MDSASAPVLMQHSHNSTAIGGIAYYDDDQWPAEFRDNIFVGNVMTSRVNRDVLRFAGSSPSAKELPDFLTSDDPWFRPVDLQFGPDGALYVADFYNRIIGHYEVPLTHPGRDRERGPHLAHQLQTRQAATAAIQSHRTDRGQGGGGIGQPKSNATFARDESPR